MDNYWTGTSTAVTNGTLWSDKLASEFLCCSVKSEENEVNIGGDKCHLCGASKKESNFERSTFVSKRGNHKTREYFRVEYWCETVVSKDTKLSSKASLTPDITVRVGKACLILP